MSQIRIPYSTVLDTLYRILVNQGFSEDRAKLCAFLFARASADGIASHGLDRFDEFLNMIHKKLVDPKAEATSMGNFGVFDRWNGNLGPGPLNAYQCMDRAITISKERGVGVVALQNTNHWMRAGNYGWQAVEEGCIGICFTNTKPNMPAWGGSEPGLGNNPLVVALPRKKGPVVLDMAMSQFSYGKLNTYLRNGEEAPYDAGFDKSGKLTKSPSDIIEHELALPIGLWKGAGLSLVLDMLAAILSGGQSTHQIGEKKEEYGVSQVFISLYPPKLGMEDWSDETMDAIIGNLKLSEVFEGSQVRYPGENIQDIRNENIEKGIPVDKSVWDNILTELP